MAATSRGFAHAVVSRDRIKQGYAVSDSHFRDPRKASEERTDQPTDTCNCSHGDTLRENKPPDQPLQKPEN